MSGFLHWAYGFFCGTFWYADPALTCLEPVRVWVSDYTRMVVNPGLLEEMLGLCVVLLGMSFRIAAQYGKE